jgi:hypothetical protein
MAAGYLLDRQAATRRRSRLPLNTPGCVTAGEPIDLSHTDTIEITWDAVFEGAGRDGESQGVSGRTA